VVETPPYIAEPSGATATGDVPEGSTTPEASARRYGRAPVLDGYELKRPIGAGGMGVVYEAVQTRAGRVVAVKLVRSLGLFDEAQRTRFDTEAKALARAPHPNIVPVYEVGEQDGTPFFSMEFAPGGSLSDRVRNGKRLPPAEAAGLIAAVAMGVEGAHKAGVLHRDLKPSNILIAADGTPKVADFGLAKLLDRDDGPTHTGAVVGTPSYMAPEQVQPRFGPVGPRTDVYGLGATLYHLLTGQPPFKAGETPLQTANQVATEDPPGVRAMFPDIDPVLDAIVRTAMEKQPADRYDSAAALADDLELWAAGKSPKVPPINAVRRVRRWVRRHRWKVAASGLVVLVTATAAVAVRESDPTRQIDRALTRGEKVTLIGGTGTPRHYQWRMGETRPPAANSDEGACEIFATPAGAVLELVSEPKQDRYRFSAELRQGRAGDGDGVAGLYFGYDEFVEPDGRRLRHFLTIECNDHDYHTDGRPTRHPRYVWCQDRLFATQGGDTTSLKQLVRGIPYEKDDTVRNRWRRVVIDVTPEQITVHWRNANDSIKTMGPMPAAEFADKRIKLQQTLNRALAGFGLDPPVWAPRRPVGLWALNATASYRNVTIEPLPPDVLTP
jgi:serine/threonine-protein kinase